MRAWFVKRVSSEDAPYRPNGTTFHSNWPSFYSYGSLKVVDQRISGYVSRIKLNWKKLELYFFAYQAVLTKRGTAALNTANALLWSLGSGSIVMVEAELLDLVYVLGFLLSNDRGFSRMTVLGTVTSRQNVGGSIERSIVGLFGRFLGSMSFIRALSLQLRWCLFPIIRVRYHLLSTFLYAWA